MLAQIMSMYLNDSLSARATDQTRVKRREHLWK
jgi:hypothetical protein